MLKFLTLYLIITGIGAFLALSMPSLVVLGFFALIIPGLILSLMPTAFLYGVVFTLAWMAAQSIIGEVPAIAAGLAAVAAFGSLTVQPTRQRDLHSYRASILPDVGMGDRIELKGDVRFDLQQPRMNKTDVPGHQYVAGQAGYACDGHCLAALFTPGVTGVTINKWSPDGGLGPEARSYRLEPRPACVSSVQVDFDGLTLPFPGDYEAGKLLKAEWAMKLANEYCLVVGPPAAKPEFTIREGMTGSGGRTGQWSFGDGRLSTQTMEIFAGDKLIHRSHQSSITTLSKFLFVEPTGGIENFRFGWGRSTINSKTGYDAVTLAKSLAATNLVGRTERQTVQQAAVARRELLPAFRQQLRSALADPALDQQSAGFQVRESYFQAIGEQATAEDVELISRLVADPRLTSFPGAWHLKLPVDQARPIYDSYTRRLLASGAPMEMQKSHASRLVENLGADAIALVGPLQEQMLADPVRRLAVPELAWALGHGGPDNGPRLLAMLQHHARQIDEIHRQRKSRQAERDANIRMIGAIRGGLCLLGPKGSAVRHQLDAFLSSGVMPPHLVEGHDMTDWNIVLARMGKPIESIAKPKSMSGSEENYRRNLRMKLERWKPDRC